MGSSKWGVWERASHTVFFVQKSRKFFLREKLQPAGSALDQTLVFRVLGYDRTLRTLRIMSLHIDMGCSIRVYMQESTNDGTTPSNTRSSTFRRFCTSCMKTSNSTICLPIKWRRLDALDRHSLPNKDDDVEQRWRRRKWRKRYTTQNVTSHLPSGDRRTMPPQKLLAIPTV